MIILFIDLQNSTGYPVYLVYTIYIVRRVNIFLFQIKLNNIIFKVTKHTSHKEFKLCNA